MMKLKKAERKLFDFVMRDKDSGEEMYLVSMAVACPFQFRASAIGSHIDIEIDHNAGGCDVEIQHVGYTREQMGYDK